MGGQICLVLRQEGGATVSVDKAEYEKAKAKGTLDHFLDWEASDMETSLWLIEPDGTEIYPWGEPHG